MPVEGRRYMAGLAFRDFADDSKTIDASQQANIVTVGARSLAILAGRIR